MMHQGKKLSTSLTVTREFDQNLLMSVGKLHSGHYGALIDKTTLSVIKPVITGSYFGDCLGNLVCCNPYLLLSNPEGKLGIGKLNNKQSVKIYPLKDYTLASKTPSFTMNVGRYMAADDRYFFAIVVDREIGCCNRILKIDTKSLEFKDQGVITRFMVTQQLVMADLVNLALTTRTIVSCSQNYLFKISKKSLKVLKFKRFSASFSTLTSNDKFAYILDGFVMRAYDLSKLEETTNLDTSMSTQARSMGHIVYRKVAFVYLLNDKDSRLALFFHLKLKLEIVCSLSLWTSGVDRFFHVLWVPHLDCFLTSSEFNVGKAYRFKLH